ncbi:MAG: GGDEF domain-containing protein [Pseudomonadota bacterium]
MSFLCRYVLVLLLALRLGCAHAGSDASAAHLDRFVDRLAHQMGGVEQEIALRLHHARAAGDRAAQLHALRDQYVMDAFLPESIRSGAAYLALAPGFDACIALATALHDEDALAIFLALRAYAESERDRELSDRYAKQAIALAERGHSEIAPYLHELNASRLLGLDEKEAMLAAQTSYLAFERKGNKVMMASNLAVMARIVRAPLTATPADLVKSMAWLDRALQLLEGGEYQALRSRLHGDYGLSLRRQGEFAKASARFELALTLAENQVDPLRIAYLTYYLGSVDVKLGHFARASTRLTLALGQFSANQNPLFSALPQLGIADAASRLGHTRVSVDALEAARRNVELAKSMRLNADYQRNTADIQARLGDHAAAYVAAMKLVDAENAIVMAGSKKRLQELTVKFDIRVKQHENALLKAEHARLESRKTALILALLFGGLLLTLIAIMLMLQIGQKRRFSALALRDELTGAPNRRHIMELAAREVKAARACGKEVWLSILDIDHFKRINDQFGHETGDLVLNLFYACCQGALRQSDALGRIGGEEFLLLSVGAAREDVLFLYQRLLAAVALIAVPAAPAGYTLTFSMGACASGFAELDVKSVMKRADAALYRAKQNGRARCEIGDSA